MTDRADPFARDTADADVEAIHEPIAREKAEPRDGYEPISIWLIFLFFALTGWGGWYMATFSGDWSSAVYDERSAAAVVPASAPGEADPLILGRRAYVRCQACHQSNGAGIAGTYPPLAGSTYVNGPAEIPIAIVLHGLQGPLTVEGKSYNNIMPAHRDLMTDEEIAAVLTYIRTKWGNNSPAVSPDEVARVRTETAGRGAAWTAAELENLAASTPEPTGENAN